MPKDIKMVYKCKRCNAEITVIPAEALDNILSFRQTMENDVDFDFKAGDTITEIVHECDDQMFRFGKIIGFNLIDK
ncbi:MAG: hypothetical protein DRN81_01240 [Thermoproteota archaeon]|nr:MAG: hypothetical protein DRN81_01240 [Candidatus Korarchaeota archaeon]